MIARGRMLRVTGIVLGLLILAYGFKIRSIIIGSLSLVLLFPVLVVTFNKRARFYSKLKKKKILLCIVSIVFFFLVMELFVRLSGLASMPTDRLTLDEIQLRYPDHNKDSFRDPLNFNQSTTDICVIGDSLTYGWCIKENDTWVHVLDKKSIWGEEITFHNLGFPGWNLKKQTNFILENEKTRKYPCDSYILLFWLNDFIANYTSLSEILVVPDTKEIFQDTITNTLLEKSHFIRLLVINYARIDNTLRFRKEIRQVFARGAFKEDLSKVMELERNILFIKIPFLPDKEFENEYDEKLFTFMNEQNASYFDMTSKIAEETENIRCSKTDLHYNEKGHALIAEQAGIFLANSSFGVGDNFN